MVQLIKILQPDSWRRPNIKTEKLTLIQHTVSFHDVLASNPALNPVRKWEQTESLVTLR